MIRIRACGAEDAAAVSALLGELGYEISVRQAVKHIWELGKTGSDPIFLAVVDGQVLGLVALHICRMLQYATPVMRVTALVVDGRARRRSIGQRLMLHAERLAAAAGCGAVELTSAVERVDAHAFYRSLGYDATSLRFRKTLTGTRA
jgi:GNAT superfamily N-acetyltransferase